MTQPPPYPTPPVGGPPPAAGGVAPPPGQILQGYAVPPHHAPPGYAIQQQYAPPGYGPPQYAPPGYGPPPWYPGPPRPVAPPPTLSPGGQPLASFTDRLLATLIDYAVFMVIGMVFTVPAMIYFFVVIAPDMFQVKADGTMVEPDFYHDFLLPLLWLELAIFAASLVLSYVYYVEMMFRTGQTLGKKTMKLRVVPLDPTRALDRWTAAKRFLAQQLVGLVPGGSYLDGFWQLWDKPWQQCLHDKAAETIVVKVAS